MSNAPHRGLDRLRKRKRPASKRVGIIVESSFQQRIEDAQQAVARLEAKVSRAGGRANQSLVSELEDAEAELEAARAEAEEHTEWFVAKAMAPRAFDDLMNAHPPTAEQKKEARKSNKSIGWNIDTFPPALLAACVFYEVPLDEPDPETGDSVHHEPLTAEFVKDMLEGGQWNVGEINALVEAAIAANHIGPQRVAGLGNG